MIEDARISAGKGPIRDRVCIVGGGVAGLVLALELERSGHSVLLLEAGSLGLDRLQRAAKAGHVEGTEHEPIEDTSARRLGGALALWGGRLLPFDRDDFDAQPSRREAWPFGYDELEPYYHLANERMDAGVYEYEPRRALPAQPAFFPGLKASTEVGEFKAFRWSPPLRYANYRAHLKTSSKVRVLFNALVTELTLDASNTRVVAATVCPTPDRRFEVQADYFVVAGGGLETARLLLASRRARPAGLGNGSQHVGRHYLTHPVCALGVLSVEPKLAKRLCSFETSRDGIYVRPVISLSSEARRARGLLNLNVTFWHPDPHNPAHGSGVLSAYALAKTVLVRSHLTRKVAGSHRMNVARDPAVHRHLVNVLSDAPRTVSTLLAWSRRRWFAQREIPALLDADHRGRVCLKFDAEQRESETNRVTLSGDSDAFGMPRLRVSYRVSQQDRESYYASLELFGAELRRAGEGTLVLPPRAEFVEHAMIGDGTHQMGLTRMSATASAGVVDENCRLHECPNVFVAGSSTFPTAGAAPPMLTTVALTLRLAAHLHRELTKV